MMLSRKSTAAPRQPSKPERQPTEAGRRMLPAASNEDETVRRRITEPFLGV